MASKKKTKVVYTNVPGVGRVRVGRGPVDRLAHPTTTHEHDSKCISYKQGLLTCRFDDTVTAQDILVQTKKVDRG